MMPKFREIWDSELGKAYECLSCERLVVGPEGLKNHQCPKEQDNAADSEEDDADDTPLFIDWNPKSSSPGESSQ